MNAIMKDKTYLPFLEQQGEEAQRALAKTAATLTKAVQSSQGTTPTLSFEGDELIAVQLPKPLLDILMQVTEAMNQGLAVSIVPHNMMLSTQEAADMLGISRPTLVRMLEEGKIPYTKTNRHRRLYLTDVLQYQERQRRITEEALDDLVSDAEMLGFYDIPHEEILDTIHQVRKDRQPGE